MATIEPGTQIPVDPADWTTLAFDWTDHFTPGSQLLSDSATVGAFEVEDVTVPSKIRELVPTVVISDVSFLAGWNNMVVMFSVKGGLPAHIYRLTHFVSTTENPTQKRKRSIFVWIKQL